MLCNCGNFTFTSGVDTFNVCGLHVVVCDSHGFSTTMFSVVVVASPPSLSPAAPFPALPAPAPPALPVAPVFPAAPFPALPLFAAAPFPALPAFPLAFAPSFAVPLFPALSPVVPSVGVVSPFSLPLLDLESDFP